MPALSILVVYNVIKCDLRTLSLQSPLPLARGIVVFRPGGHMALKQRKGMKEVTCYQYFHPMAKLWSQRWILIHINGLHIKIYSLHARL